MNRPARRRRGFGWPGRVAVAAVLILASPLLAPRLLAFPHSTTVGQHHVYSDMPITPAVRRIVGAADDKVRASPLGDARPLDQDVVLTDGGWRWRWLAISASDAFALSRPLGEPVIVNHSDPSRDIMTNAYGATRRLTDVVAHELTHGAIRARFGIVRAQLMPAELVEGYCDHVAGSSTLSDAQAKALIASGQTRPALLYWTGRKKVEAALEANGNDVDRLFEEWR
ncbi:hypothetical protein GCM10022280_23810 [Sphingomonas swuensis]|uniref:DUF4157 domain-containing protein n=1 Tax=Sphingomonas swuensis TaxID=977800 RepID=A0ABP7T7W5_9SPHN